MPKIKKVYIYKDSHLPEDGWIQLVLIVKH